MNRFPPRLILVPFDLSPQAEHAWESAVGLARRFGSALEAVHVDLPCFELEPSPGGPDAQSQAARAAWDKLRAKTGANVRTFYLRGDPAETIVRLAQERRPDLVVMGTHGRLGVARFLIGSVAEAVTKSSPSPVLALRGPARAIRNVLAPVNFEPYAEVGAAYAATLAQALGARLTLLHVGFSPDSCPDPKTRLAELAARLPGKTELRARFGSPVEEILLESHKHDLVVLTAHSKSLLSDLVLGTTVERVLRHCPVPVLGVPSVNDLKEDAADKRSRSL